MAYSALASLAGAGSVFERTSETADRIEGSRDLALIRLVPSFASGMPDDAVDDTLGTTFDVVSSGETVTNRALFLTSFHTSAPGTRHAERPKLVPLGGGAYVVLFERWSTSGSQMFEGTFALRIDAAGVVQAGPTRVSDHHLPRGDDAFAYADGAAWLTGDEVERTLSLHLVHPDLSITETVIP